MIGKIQTLVDTFQGQEPAALDIFQWSQDIVEGPGGYNNWKQYEWVDTGVSDRVAVAQWIIRCLANPNCAGSGEVLKMIVARREDKSV